MILNNDQYIFMAIAMLRFENKITQQTIADMIGVNQSTYSRFENGEIKLSDSDIEKIYSLFKIQYNPNPEEYVDSYFEDIIQSIYYQNDLCYELFDYLKVQNDIIGSVNYVVYSTFRLLDERLMKHAQKRDFQLKKVGHIAKYLPEDLKVIYLTAKGRIALLKKQNNEALYCFQEASRYTSRDYRIKSIAMEELQKLCVKLNHKLVKEELLEELSILYQRDYNFLRMINLCYTQGLYQMAQSDFKKAEKIFNKRVSALRGNLTEETLKYYETGTLLWALNLLLSRNYETLTKFRHKVNKNVSEQHMIQINYLQCIALYMLGKTEEASYDVEKYYYQLSTHKDKEFKMFFDLSRNILNGKDIDIDKAVSVLFSLNNVNLQILLSLLLLKKFESIDNLKVQSQYEMVRKLYYKKMNWVY